MQLLETERLILRTWEQRDIEPMAEIDQDPLVCRYLAGIGTSEATTAAIQRFIQHQEEKGFSLYAVELKATHEMIGFIGLLTPSFQAHFTPAIEIGWRLTSKYWNDGYATEGAKAVLQHAFTTLNLPNLVSFTAVNNRASRRVMEKIGMHHNQADNFNHPNLSEDSPLRRHVLYRLSKEEYLAQTKK